MKLADLRFQVLVDVLSPANESHGGEAVAVAIKSILGSLNNFRVICGSDDS